MSADQTIDEVLDNRYREQEDLRLAVAELGDAIFRLEETIDRHDCSRALSHEEKIAAIDAVVPKFASTMTLLIDILESSPKPLESLDDLVHRAISDGMYGDGDELERRLMEFIQR